MAVVAKSFDTGYGGGAFTAAHLALARRGGVGAREGSLSQGRHLRLLRSRDIAVEILS